MNCDSFTIAFVLIAGVLVVLGLAMGVTGTILYQDVEPRICNVTQHFNTLRFLKECDGGGDENGCDYYDVAYYYGSIIVRTNMGEYDMIFVAEQKGGSSKDPEPVVTAENIYASNQVIYILNNTFPAGAQFPCYYSEGTVSLDSKSPFYGLMIAGFVIFAFGSLLFGLLGVSMIYDKCKKQQLPETT